MTPITSTARVSRTWSSTRCSMTGIFLSSSGVKTLSCSHFPIFTPSDIAGGPLSWAASGRRLLRIDRHEEVVPLPAQQQDDHLFFFDLGGRLLIFIQALDYAVIDLLYHVPALNPSRFRRAPRLHVIDQHAGGLGGK